MRNVILRNKIKEKRESLGITQRELSDASGVIRETIGHLEVNNYNPSLLIAHKIATALNSNISEIFYIEELK